MRSERRRPEQDFAHYLRTGRRRARLELKFNHSHDPADGRFTSGDGEGGGGGGHAAGQSRPAARAPGPFHELAKRTDAVGTTAKAVDAFVAGQNATLDLPLGGRDGTVTLTRISGNTVELDHLYFSASGELHVLPNHPEIAITLSNPKLKIPLVSIASFPSQIRIFQGRSGNLNFSLDKELSTRLFKTTIWHDKGSFLFKKTGK